MNNTGVELMAKASRELFVIIKASIKTLSASSREKASQRGLVVGLDKLDNQEVSEIVTVQNLIATLDIQGVVFSLDALHCQKKLAS